MGLEDVRADSRDFIYALLDEDDAVLRESTERLGSGRGIVVLSSLLALVVAQRFGIPLVLDEISEYSKTTAAESDGNPRRIVLESVIRAGGGDGTILDGLPEDEVLTATAIVLRRMMGELEEQSTSRIQMIEQAVELAADQPMFASDE